MGIFNWISSIGSTLGLIRVVEVQDPEAPEKITARSITLKDLATEIRGEEVRNLAELPTELAITFDRIFEAAGIKPAPHGWTIERIKSLLATDQFKSMDRLAIQKAILGLLATEKAQVDDLVKDAIARDQAIDAYETFTQKKLDSRTESRQRRIAEIESQIRQLRDEIARLNDESKLDQDRFRDWRKTKIAYEKDLAATLSYLLDKPIITITEDAPPTTNNK
ncbi:MAG: hypothetical protein NTU53_09155 [Planctomycetota bacterium]|nr:hypothetical protein [Planctomycetota bacterium]